jgi:Mg2+/Co2+ transporter CorB
MIATILVIILLIALSAFFSGSETALTAASRPRIHALESKGNRRAALVNHLQAHMEQVIGAVLLSNTLVNILASALATSLLITLVGEHGVLYATIAMTVLIVLFGEVLPKTFAINRPERAALGVAPAMRAIVTALRPVTLVTQMVARALLRLFGVPVTTELGRHRAEEELRGAIDLHAKTVEEVKHAGAMLHSILDLEEVGVGDIMVHRRNVEAIDADQPPSTIVAQVLASPYTRIPLWRRDPDNIIGVLHAKALLRAVRAEGASVHSLDIAKLAAPPWFIPDTTSLLAQLQAFRARREHFAIVVDEYGALMGIVTLEDILEEIVGEISDEHDIPVGGVKPEPEGSYRVNGLVTIRDLNRQFGWRLPDEAASTIAGLVLHEARRIPEEKQVFVFHGFRFEIVERQRNQIKSVRITPPPDLQDRPGKAARVPSEAAVG